MLVLGRKVGYDMKYTVLIASDALQKEGFTHTVNHVDGRKPVAAFTSNSLASEYMDGLHAKEQAPKVLGAGNALTLAQKIEAAKNAGS
jgi:hypothetical protein